MNTKILNIIDKIFGLADKIPDGNVRAEIKGEIKKAEILLRQSLSIIIGIVTVMIFANYFIRCAISPEYMKEYREAIDLVLLGVGVKIISGMSVKDFKDSVKNWYKNKKK